MRAALLSLALLSLAAGCETVAGITQDIADPVPTGMVEVRVVRADGGLVPPAATVEVGWLQQDYGVHLTPAAVGDGVVVLGPIEAAERFSVVVSHPDYERTSKTCTVGEDRVEMVLGGGPGLTLAYEVAERWKGSQLVIELEARAGGGIRRRFVSYEGGGTLEQSFADLGGGSWRPIVHLPNGGSAVGEWVEALDQRVSVQLNAPVEATVVLVPWARQGAWSKVRPPARVVATLPSGETVEGVPRPADVFDRFDLPLEEGRVYPVQVLREGFAPVQAELDLTARDQPSFHTWDLPDPATGSVRLCLETEAGAPLRVRGLRLKGANVMNEPEVEIPRGHDNCIVQRLPPGEFEIEVTLSDGERFSVEQRIEPGESVERALKSAELP